MAIKFRKTDELWLVPIRYWETVEPERVVVWEDADERAALGYLYVYHDGYGHDTYVPAERCYASRENAIKAAQLLADLRALKKEDEAEYILDKSLDAASAVEQNLQFSQVPVERKKVVHKATGYIEMPDHNLRNSIKVKLACSRSDVIYWDSYEANKAAKASPVKASVVEVEVRPLQILEAV